MIILRLYIILQDKIYLIEYKQLNDTKNYNMKNLIFPLRFPCRIYQHAVFLRFSRYRTVKMVLMQASPPSTMQAQ